MLKKLNLLLVTLIILAAGSVAFSQDSSRQLSPRPTAKPSERAEKLLVALEQIPKRIMETRIYRKQDADDLKNIVVRYAEAYTEQLEHVSNPTEITAITQERAGNTSLLQDFEKSADNHAGRFLAIYNSLVEIDRAVKAGEIILSPDNEQSSYNGFGANLNKGGCSSVNNFSSTNLLSERDLLLPRLRLPPWLRCVIICDGDSLCIYRCLGDILFPPSG